MQFKTMQKLAKYIKHYSSRFKDIKPNKTNEQIVFITNFNMKVQLNESNSLVDNNNNIINTVDRSNNVKIKLI